MACFAAWSMQSVSCWTLALMFLLLSVSSSLHSMSDRFWNFGQSAFCSSSWVPSSERWSVLSVSLSVEPAGGHCLPAGCEPVTYLLNILTCDSKVRGAQRLPRTGKACGLIIWSVDEDEAVLNHPIFCLLSFAIEISISPAWRVAIEIAGDE